MLLDDCDCDDEEDENKVNGYCHFNTNGDDTTFTLNVFGHDLTLEQLPSNTKLGHGAVIWDAAVVFVKYMEHNPSLFNTTTLSGQSVLELGSGCGLAGLAMMMKGAHVTLTDLEDVVETLTRSNAGKIYNRMKSLGNLGLPLTPPVVCALNWTDAVDVLGDQLFDVILLTDCVFSVALAPFLIATILRHAHVRTEVICCHEIRDEDANREFVDMLKMHCHIKRVAEAKRHPDYQSDQIEIVTAKLKRKKNS